MSRRRGWIVAALVCAVMGCLSVPAPADDGRASPMWGALILQAAGRIDDTLAAVEASTRGLAAAYGELARTSRPMSGAQRALWLQHGQSRGDTVALRDPATADDPQPAALAPAPAYYFYGGDRFTEEAFRQLDILSRLAPALAVAHDAFPFSWVYATAPSQNFVIYPYLPMDEAVHNARPTEQNFYAAADFKHKACGWESPYLDLVGAGMMVTVSCPAFDGEKPLGVVSHDITLTQLSAAVLADLASIPKARAVVVNRRGKAIAASDPQSAAAVSEENAKAKDAVVYFRADRGLVSLGVEKGISSPDERMNAAVETVIERAAANPPWPIVFDQDGAVVMAAHIKTTGWYVVLLVPEKTLK